MKKDYKEGYTEAISDLHRCWYEKWIEDEEGDFKQMAESILNTKKHHQRCKK